MEIFLSKALLVMTINLILNTPVEELEEWNYWVVIDALQQPTMFDFGMFSVNHANVLLTEENTPPPASREGWKWMATIAEGQKDC